MREIGAAIGTQVRVGVAHVIHLPTNPPEPHIAALLDRAEYGYSNAIGDGFIIHSHAHSLWMKRR